MAKYVRLGDLLVSAGVISEQQLTEALAIQKNSGGKLGRVLVDNHIISENQLVTTLQQQLGVDYIDAAKADIDPSLSKMFSKEMAKKYNIVPIKEEKGELYIAMSDPLNFRPIEEVKMITRKRVIPMISMEGSIERAIAKLYGNEGVVRSIEEMQKESGIYQAPEETAFTGLTLEGDDDSYAPTIRLVNSIVERAVTERASDIHLEPRENGLFVRLRIDGVLHNVLNVPREFQSNVISRIKIMGGMDIAERKRPQDGRSGVKTASMDVDLRISTLPTVYGEKVVIRLLDKSNQFLTPTSIGMTGTDLDKYNGLLKHSSGVILITGPTGSGKSSTMSTMIRQLNTERVNLVTLEDPVEFNIDGVNQVQINEKTGMTFASGLRSILRQDPDIIAVGEIRDAETATISMRAGVTGHLVLSTLHTNDAVSAISRLTDIGTERYLISDALKGIISQRLVRRICPHCKESYPPSREELEALGMEEQFGNPELKFYRGRGCPMCYDTGYRGRMGVFEVLVVDRKVRNVIGDINCHEKIHDILMHSDFVSLRDNCKKLVLEGVTTLEEAKRTIYSMEEE